MILTLLIVAYLLGVVMFGYGNYLQFGLSSLGITLLWPLAIVNMIVLNIMSAKSI